MSTSLPGFAEVSYDSHLLWNVLILTENIIDWCFWFNNMRCKPAGHLIKIPEYHLDKVYLPKNMLVRFYCSMDNISSLGIVGFCRCLSKEFMY